MVAASSGLLTWTFLELGMLGKPSAVGVVSGALAGLVGITPAAGFVPSWSAYAIGAVTAAVTCCSVHGLKRLHWWPDDSLDAFGLHGVG